MFLLCFYHMQLRTTCFFSLLLNCGSLPAVLRDLWPSIIYIFLYFLQLSLSYETFQFFFTRDTLDCLRYVGIYQPNVSVSSKFGEKRLGVLIQPNSAVALSYISIGMSATIPLQRFLCISFAYHLHSFVIVFFFYFFNFISLYRNVSFFFGRFIYSYKRRRR